MFRSWDSPSPIAIGSCVHLSPRSPSRGAGTDLLLSYEEVWPGTLAQRIILDPEESVLDDDGKSGGWNGGETPLNFCICVNDT